MRDSSHSKSKTNSVERDAISPDVNNSVVVYVVCMFHVKH